MSDSKPTVDTAYALKTPADSRELYSGWAESYDRDFAQRMEFLMPQQVADVFWENGGRGPVLDAGAGTGLVGEALARGGACVVDALDITPEMLRVAARKGVYRDTIEADLLARLPIPDGRYHAVLSSGTFTHGHVGPEALDELLRVAASGALFVLTIKKEYFHEHGFAAKFAAFSSQVMNFETMEKPIYGAGATPDHAGDRGLIAIFTKC